MKTYHVEMEDGFKLSVMGESAGHAINRALYRCRGRRVAKVYSNGQDRPDAEYGDFNARLGGVINYEIPPHKPIDLYTPEPLDL